MKRGKKITDLVDDMVDGVNLCALLEIISEEKMPGKINAVTKIQLQKVENLNMALKFIDNHGVKLVNIGSTELVEGNKHSKLWLGLIWSVILRFAIAGLSEEGLSAKEGLLLWCQRKTKGYEAVDIKDFTGSWQNGLAFLALIHRHRPDLVGDWTPNPNDARGNLEKAFSLAEEHCDIPRLIDIDDIVNMPKPDERSIMTQVAAYYKAFSSLDNVETAGRRVNKFAEFEKQIYDLTSEYERRTTALNAALNGKTEELESATVGENYNEVKSNIGDFRQYKRVQKRQWIAEQNDLAALFTTIQAKLKSMNRSPYVPPAGLHVDDVTNNVESLTSAERARRSALSAQLRAILEALKKAFAEPANAFAQQLEQLRASLAKLEGELEDQLATAQGNQQTLQGLGDQLSSLEASEQACNDANIEDNEHTEYTADDLSFEYEQLKTAYSKAITTIQSQIAARQSTGVSAEQYAEFKKSYDHYDQDGDGVLTRLELKSALTGLGVISVDFEGGDKRFEGIWAELSKGGNHCTFEAFAEFMTKITSDAVSPEQLKDAFSLVAGSKDFVTAADLQRAQLDADLIAYLKEKMPAYPGVADGYDYKAYLANAFN
jgi:Ca2+-binding EF-hand superfamily protein